MAKFCHNCGSPLNGAEKFCSSCGAQVMAAPQPQEGPDEKPRQAQQEMNHPPAPRTVQERPQPIMNQNAPGQSAGQQPYGAFPGQGGPNAYGMGMMGAQGFHGGAYVPDQGIKEMFFRYDNRLNRKRYIMRALGLVVAVTLAATVIGFVLAVAGVNEATIGTMGSLIGIAGAVPGLMLVIRRLHDLDRPTWWIVGNFIPLVNCVLGLYLLFAKGTDGPNQYGPDPLEGQL